MRDALSITDQAVAYGGGKLLHSDVVAMLGLVGRDEIGALMQALATGKAEGVLAVAAELAERGVDFEEVLAGLLAALHRAAVEQATAAQTDALLAPEVVQLYYQIALTGYRDMQVVPDPRSGFEMTLLRMLAFTPEALPANAPSAPPSVQDPSPEEQTPATDSTPQRPPTGSGTELADGTPWHEVVDSLALTGVARMIAEHTVVGADKGGKLELVLDNAHDTLLNDAQSAAIQRALTERLEKEIIVQIAPGAVHAETPAQRWSRQQAERQQGAEQMLETDQTVQSLLSEFGGKLDGVTPLEADKWKEEKR
jgi:DNA polymerase-3 subunit gamma/tau